MVKVSFKAANRIAHGNWVDGFLEGIGRQRYADGSEYYGQFHKGKPHGQGTFTLSNRKVYVGQFLNGKPVGKGVFYKDHKQYETDWSNHSHSISISLHSMLHDRTGALSDVSRISSKLSQISKMSRII